MKGTLGEVLRDPPPMLGRPHRNLRSALGFALLSLKSTADAADHLVLENFESVRLTQGPWERPLDLASVHVDSTPGPVKVMALHLDAGAARAIADAQALRAERGRAQDRTTRWAAEQLRDGASVEEPGAGQPDA